MQIIAVDASAEIILAMHEPIFLQFMSAIDHRNTHAEV